MICSHFSYRRNTAGVVNGKFQKPTLSFETAGASAAMECVNYNDMLAGKCLVALLRTVCLCVCVSMLVGASCILLPVASLAANIEVLTVSTAMTTYFVVSGSLSVLGGSSVDRFGRGPAMVTACLFFSSGMACLAFLVSTNAGARLHLLFGAAVLFGLGDATSVPLKSTLKNDYADFVKLWAIQNNRDQKSAIAKSFGLLDVFNDLLGVGYPVILALVATYMSTSASCWCFCGAGLFASIAVIWFFPTSSEPSTLL